MITSNFTEAINTVKYAFRRKPRHVPALFILAESLQFLSKPEEANFFYTIALEEDQNQALVY